MSGLARAGHEPPAGASGHVGPAHPNEGGAMLACARLALDGMLDRLAAEDAIALPMLTEAARLELLVNAMAVSYRPARQAIGEGERRVLQRMEVSDEFSPDSPFRRLRREFQALWDRTLDRPGRSPFEGRLTFNDLMLQRYEVGELGITAHRDRTAYRNLVCLFVLAGKGAFHVCRDRGGSGSREIPHRPGDVLLMRAPGFLASCHRPFHYLHDVRETRYVFGLRQERA